MFARVVEVSLRHEKKDEVIETMRKEVLPILKKQHGFLEYLPLVPENKTEKVLSITLWTEKYEAEKYAKEVFPRVEGILKPFLTAPIVVKMFEVETTLCERLVETLTAAA
jgi:quinol monooxygenase YgiN